MTTDPEGYARAFAVVRTARHLEGPALEEHLDEACRGDAALRAIVVDLLAAGRDEGAMDPFADRNVQEARMELEGVLETADTTWLPEQIGGYTILRQIGRGGMGIVYEALQEAPRRRVAIKLLHPSQLTESRLKRFRQEAQLLGRLQHPGIAQIHEAGTYDAGSGPQPYFAMELVEGVDIRTHCERAVLDARARIELLARVADAIQYAHERGVVHRDLKPDNVLVNTRGQPRILDFGIARPSSDSTALSTVLTEDGQLVGTLGYMAPELLNGDGEVTPLVDVYALGALAYELLVGRLPRDVPDLPLSQVIPRLAEAEAPPAGALDPDLRGDVETILGKALEAEPGRRYGAAAAFASDLRRHLADQPIDARPPGRIYRARKFVRRHRGLAAGVVATLAVALTGAGVATRFALAATDRARELEQVTAFQADQLSAIDAEGMGLGLRRAILEEARVAFEKAGAPVEERLAELESLLAGTNFTDVALVALEENVFDTALETMEVRFADQPLVRADLLQTLASTLASVGLLDAAMSPQRSALEVRRELLGSRHPATLQSMFELGLLHEALGDYATAEPLLTEALAGRREVLGTDHPDTITSIGRLGFLLQVQERMDEADPLLREALTTRARTLGDGAPDTWLWRGGQAWRDGDLVESERCWRAGLALARRDLGDDHRETLNLIKNLALALVERGKLAETEPLCRELLAARRRRLGDEHPRTLEALTQLAEVLAGLDRPAEARPLLREAYERQRRLLGADHPETVKSQRVLEELP